MAASLHLVRYSPRHVPRMLARMRRELPALEASPGLVATRLFVLATFDRIVGGTPVFSRWGVLCGWGDAAARDRFLADGDRLRPLLRGAVENWNVSLETVRIKDDWWGWRPETDGVERFAVDEPVLVMTYAMLRPRHWARFTWHNVRVVRASTEQPGLVNRIGFADSPLARGTLSVWRSERDATQFAYREVPHRVVQKRARQEPWGDHFCFARFRPLATSGTWDGGDPLAGG